MRDEAGAVAAWTKVLALDESDVVALDALLALHEHAQRVDELVDVLDRRLGASSSAEEQVALKTRIAAITPSSWERSIAPLKPTAICWTSTRHRATP